MAILGPDGQPINSGPPTPPQVLEMIEQSKQIAAEGNIGPALQQLAFAFQLDVSSDPILNATIDLLKQMAQMAGDAQSYELQLFENVRDNREDPEAYYQVGSHFFQVGQTFIAGPFLFRARQLAGDALSQLSLQIDVELGQVLMELGEYQGATESFQRLNDNYGGLPVELILKMSECFALQRKTEEAHMLYDLIPEEDITQSPPLLEWYEETGDLLARVEDFEEEEEELDLRAWHYVQTRGILLASNPDENVPGERFVFFQPSEQDVAQILGLAAAVLDEKGYAPNRIVWLGESSEALARIFAEWWEVDEENLRLYQPGDNTDSESELTLLVMSHSFDFSGLISQEEVEAAGSQEALMELQNQRLSELADAREGMIVFMLDITPDIGGFLTQICNLPWETRLQVNETTQEATQIEETRDAVTIAKDVAKHFPAEEECESFARDLLEDFSMCRDLILDHRDGTLKRKSLVTHSPVKSPRFGY
jgi:tetratricopeptide (TPR) repeat protein